MRHDALYAIKRDVYPMQWALERRGIRRIDLCETGMTPHMRPICLQKTLYAMKSDVYPMKWALLRKGIRRIDLCKMFSWYCVCCRVLQCVAECCSVLQCVAVCCSVLQCVESCETFSWYHVTADYVWPDSFICVPWLVHMCAMTYSYVTHDL